MKERYSAMRALFNTYPVAFDCPGGGEVQLFQSMAALQRAGVKVELYNPWQPQFDEVDIVHYFSVQGGSSCFCDHVKKRGIPLVISPILWLTDENKPLLPLDEIAALLAGCDLVLPNSATEAQRLSDHFGLDRKKFVVTFNGVDESFTEPVPESIFREHFGVHDKFVLNVANIEPRKNQLRLIQAVRDLDMKPVLIGRIRDRAYFEECMHFGRGFVRYVGHLDHEDDLLKSAYRACGVFALPSLLETPGLAALEAAATGAKVVITAEGCTREYFEDMVRYVDPYDVDMIRREIQSASAHDRSGAQLADHVLSHFTWDRTAEQLIAAYKSVV